MLFSHRFASAVSLIALGTMLAGCAAPQRHTVSASGFGGKANGEIGLATRALAALNSNDIPTAISFAERAVEKTPSDAGFRALLGNAYFAGGRFWSAEAAYKDALAIYGQQPQVVLKLALVEIALGKRGEALQLLQSAQPLLDAADFGLALVLAGRAGDAIPLLEATARVPGADSRVRQNLALAYAFVGDWQQARTIAAQDVPANQLDARLQQWMQLAKPHRASDQVAALTGVTPATRDSGQPIRLALRKPEVRQAQAAPVVAPVRASAPRPQVAVAAPPPPVRPVVVAQAPAPQFAETAIARAEVAPALAAAPKPAPVAAKAPKPAPAPLTVAQAAAIAPEAPSIFAAFAPKVAAPKPAKVRRAAAPTQRPVLRNAALQTGKSNTVVQLGSYRSAGYVNAAWATLTQRHPALRAYLPLRARFDSPKGTFYRLSIRGFASQQEAIARCQQLKSRGGSCFVRGVAGDAPMQIASR